MTVLAILTVVKLLLLLFVLVGIPDAMAELSAICGVSRSGTHGRLDSFGTHLKLLVGVLVVLVLLFVLEPEYRAVLLVVDAIGIDMFLMLLAIQFYFYALAARVALRASLARLARALLACPGTWPVAAQWRHSRGFAVQLTGLQLGLFGVWVIDRMRVLGPTSRSG